MTKKTTKGACVCNERVAPASFRDAFGKVINVLCKKCKCMPASTSACLASIDVPICPCACAGISRCGKSTLLNLLCAAAAAQVPSTSDCAVAALETFPTSSEMRACTDGVLAMLLPRCDAAGRLSGVLLVYDAEGQDLGDSSPLEHQAMLGVVARSVTHLSFLEMGHFTMASVRSLSGLLASIHAVPVRGAAAVRALPHLTLVANKFSLAMPPAPLAWLRTELLSKSADAAAIERAWDGRLDVRLVPMNASALLPAEQLAALPAEARAALSMQFDNAAAAWVADVLRVCVPFSLASIVAGGSTRPMMGADYVAFSGDLIREYFAAESMSAPPSAVGELCRKKAAQLATAQEAEYETRRDARQLSLADNDVSGARGFWEDTAAQIRWLQHVAPRHAQLANDLLAEFDVGVQQLAGLGSDDVLTSGRRVLQLALDAKLAELRAHFDHMRCITASRSEHSTQDEALGDRVHHLEFEPYLTHTITHTFWAKWVRRHDVTRTIATRRNDDTNTTPWTRTGQARDVQVAGPWLGPAP